MKKEILKETREPGKSRKKKGQPKGWRNGFLEGLRGKGGGYKLTRAPETYTVGSILRLTEGSLATVACLEEGAPACPRMAECRTYPLWYKLDGMISEYLDSVTLADLMQYPDAGNEYVI